MHITRACRSSSVEGAAGPAVTQQRTKQIALTMLVQLGTTEKKVALESSPTWSHHDDNATDRVVQSTVMRREIRGQKFVAERN